jgi:hypothetical protein
MNAKARVEAEEIVAATIAWLQYGLQGRADLAAAVSVAQQLLLGADARLNLPLAA